jgi:hypothetical protein
VHSEEHGINNQQFKIPEKKIIISEEQHQLEYHPHPGTKIFFLACVILEIILGIKPYIAKPTQKVETL